MKINEEYQYYLFLFNNKSIIRNYFRQLKGIACNAYLHLETPIQEQAKGKYLSSIFLNAQHNRHIMLKIPLWYNKCNNNTPFTNCQKNTITIRLANNTSQEINIINTQTPLAVIKRDEVLCMIAQWAFYELNYFTQLTHKIAYLDIENQTTVCVFDNQDQLEHDSQNVQQNSTATLECATRNFSTNIACGRTLLLKTTSNTQATITRSFESLADIMAIINYTNDSFSDGGKYHTVTHATARVIQQVKLGANIIDIGAQSTNPNSVSLSSTHEINMLTKILPAIIQLKYTLPHFKHSHNTNTANNDYCNFKISIDTYYHDTVAWLLTNYSQDIDIINDVSGNLALELVKEIFNQQHMSYIAMHSLTVPASKTVVMNTQGDYLSDILTMFTTKINAMLKYGINLYAANENSLLGLPQPNKTSRLIIDPGIGFGKTATQSWDILRHLSHLNQWQDQLACEMLIGHSRKSFLSYIGENNVNDRDWPSALIAATMAPHIDYIRLHDIATFNRANNVLHELNLTA